MLLHGVPRDEVRRRHGSAGAIQRFTPGARAIEQTESDAAASGHRWRTPGVPWHRDREARDATATHRNGVCWTTRIRSRAMRGVPDDAQIVPLTG